ncbi:autotransporter outer membrane beta-barrel domain-containing protein, partial [bacterium]|nr:autotransporter outer membrane beta-barrel domain-containing protein [bacterium]
LQPIMFMSYTFVNTFDYTNAAGVKINASPAHSIQLNPSVRFIANAKNGWQPYASVGMVWNVMNENKVTANAVRLPEMSMKPYVEYGIGIQRNWKDRFTAFGQAMLRHGGRNGVALTAGFRWAIGKDSSTEKVQNTSEKLTSARTILKQMSEPQKVVLKKQNTMTTKVATVKQL